MLWVAGGFAILNFIKMIWTDVEWLFKKFGIETKGMREKREAAEQLAENKKDIAEIKTAIVEIKENFSSSMFASFSLTYIIFSAGKYF